MRTGGASGTLDPKHHHPTHTRLPTLSFLTLFWLNPANKKREGSRALDHGVFMDLAFGSIGGQTRSIGGQTPSYGPLLQWVLACCRISLGGLQAEVLAC